MVNLKAKPFYLGEDDIRWVEQKLAGMTLEEKVGQLFCINIRDFNDMMLDYMFNTMQPGGVMYRAAPLEDEIAFTAKLQDRAKIPMLIAANLERGGNGIVEGGVSFGSPMAVAATNEVETAGRMGEVCAKEGKAVGANWSFAPIIDLDYNWRNPITNTRTLGSDPDRVASMGKAYVERLQEHGLAACIKHFPGDGRDERDQHLVSSINDFSCEEWDATYGMVYKTCIEAGAMTLMVGHILQPAYSKFYNPSLKDEEILPASLSKELLIDLLRGKLGFNGLICTDATTMAGFTIPAPRSVTVPLSIAAGCDVFLFAKNLEEDFNFMLNGVKNGVITAERLDEAVTRILATKAALKLHKNPLVPDIEESRKIIGCEQHQAWAKECADKAVTLVKSEPGVLPLSPEKHKRILYFPIESEQGFAYSVRTGVTDMFCEMLKKEGFEVTTFEPNTGMEGFTATESSVTDNYDLCLYLANMSTKSNQTTVRIEWKQPMGANCPHYITSIPTVFASVENPYHLIDVPRIRTFVNAYASTDDMLDALMDKLMGRSEFKGTSPVDPFLGKWDTRLQ